MDTQQQFFTLVGLIMGVLGLVVTTFIATNARIDNLYNKLNVTSAGTKL